jgi:hypothetical protein
VPHLRERIFLLIFRESPGRAPPRSEARQADAPGPGTRTAPTGAGASGMAGTAPP